MTSPAWWKKKIESERAQNPNAKKMDKGTESTEHDAKKNKPKSTGNTKKTTKIPRGNRTTKLHRKSPAFACRSAGTKNTKEIRSHASPFSPHAQNTLHHVFVLTIRLLPDSDSSSTFTSRFQIGDSASKSKLCCGYFPFSCAHSTAPLCLPFDFAHLCS